MEHPFLVLIIFVLTYFVIAMQRLPGLKIDRPGGVVVGSTLLILTGLISLKDAYNYIDWNVITFLLGMMILIAYLEFAGFFELVAHWLVSRASNSNQLLGLTVLSSAILSAFFVNDTICLLITPVLLKTTHRLKLNPLPYLIAIAMSANIGSALTVTGNPQNMYIGIHGDIHYLRFTLIMLVPVICGLLLIYFFIRLVFKNEINRKKLSSIPRAPLEIKRVLIGKTLGALFVTMILFMIGTAYPLAALTGASLILILGHISPRLVFKEVDWSILLFFAGLFIVMGAFEKAGYVESFIHYSRTVLSGGQLEGQFGIAFAAAFMCNIVSNVPAVILMKPLIVDLGGTHKLWILLALSATFAGNLTLVGSVANLIVAEKATDGGARFSFWNYAKIGFPATVILIVLGVLWLNWVL